METTIQGLGFPKIGGTILGLPRKRTIVFWDLYWGPPYLCKLPHEPEERAKYQGQEALTRESSREHPKTTV